jgi:hypothetical protein
MPAAPAPPQARASWGLRLTARLRQDTAVPKPPPAPAAKKTASWILTPPGDLADDARAALAQITYWRF